MYYLVCPIGVIGGKHDLLTYQTDTELALGQVVSVPFGSKIKTGVIWKTTIKPEFAAKKIEKIHDSEIMPAALIKLADWMSDYYAARLPLVLQAMLPRGLGTARRGVFEPDVISETNNQHKPNDEQQKAIELIENSKHTSHLLHGVTGSGKTLVYTEVAKKVLAEHKSVIILVPEIALTPQLAANFAHLSKNLLILHSQLTEAKRHLAWQALAESDQPWVVIGPRSALFAPLKNIGLIVVDECHEPSFSQDSQPKYSALRATRVLADIHSAKLILGSATPSVNDYYFAKQTKTPIISLEQTTKTYQREVTIVDATKKELFSKNHYLSNQLLEAMQTALENNEQILLFHNRRATARMALCTACGWSAECPNCHIPLRLHHDAHLLRCHVCAYSSPAPSACPSCNQPDVEFRGFGSKRIEQEVQKLFPKGHVARFDSDTSEKEQIQHRYHELVSGEIDIIIGTQGLTKGLDLPKLSTIGVVSSDTELYVPDFSSAERTFQLISQVLGRAGRMGQKSRVFIQSLNPENFVISAAKSQNYQQFYDYEIKQRQVGHLPPFTFLLQLQIGYKNQLTAENHCHSLKQRLKKQHPKVTIYEPTSAFHAYRAGKHFMQLVITSQRRQTLVEIAKNLPANWQFTLDPINLL